MKNAVPIGFELFDTGAGFMDRFGPVYLCSATRTLGFRVASHHLNPVNVCNGGAMATFADLQIIAVVFGPGTAEAHSPTIHLSVDYLAPAPFEAWVEATVTLVKATRSLIFTQALITVDGSPVARSNAIYRIYKRLAERTDKQLPTVLSAITQCP